MLWHLMLVKVNWWIFDTSVAQLTNHTLSYDVVYMKSIIFCSDTGDFEDSESDVDLGESDCDCNGDDADDELKGEQADIVAIIML